ncbi:hypothetical protein PIB30_040617 [Stylosanthes scabra]|uniref:Uncharacterized protein n=1 Tax=Stylosanthes scabra TaxID=79078 RepID=A0ABU6TEV9_9FABA|nr:hypothetical protein [Stylosanthes scabra]
MSSIGIALLYQRQAAALRVSMPPVIFHPRHHQPHLLLFLSAVNLPHSSYCSSTKSSTSINGTRRSQRLHKLQVQEPSSSPPSQSRCSPPPIRGPARILTPRV